jgi:hypothetical protein
MKADFSGYATKAGLKCSDGRTIMPEAFKHMDGKTVPLVWQHGHNSPENVLGHAVLEAREDGVYAYGYFNDTHPGENAKRLVQHNDIKNLSIYANQLVEKAKSVFHGVIREVSLVLSGANPGALIDFVAIQHSDGDTEVLDDEAVIYTGLEIQHDDSSNDDNQNGSVSHEDDDDDDDDDDTTVQDIYDSLSEEQKNVVHYMIGAALEAAGKKGDAEHSDKDEEDDDLSHKEGSQEMNVFEQNGKTGKEGGDKHVLTHDAIKGIILRLTRVGSSEGSCRGVRSCSTASTTSSSCSRTIGRRTPLPSGSSVELSGLREFSMGFARTRSRGSRLVTQTSRMRRLGLRVTSRVT